MGGALAVRCSWPAEIRQKKGPNLVPPTIHGAFAAVPKGARNSKNGVADSRACLWGVFEGKILHFLALFRPKWAKVVNHCLLMVLDALSAKLSGNIC